MDKQLEAENIQYTKNTEEQIKTLSLQRLVHKVSLQNLFKKKKKKAEYPSSR